MSPTNERTISIDLLIFKYPTALKPPKHQLQNYIPGFLSYLFFYVLLHL